MPRLLRLALLASVGVAALAAAPSGAASPAPSYGAGDPSFVVSAAPSTLPNANSAGEPSLGVSWKSDNAFFQSYSSTYKLRFDDRATPPTVSWANVSSPYSLFNADPILATDPASGTTLAGGDDGSCAVLSRTTDAGESWSPTLPCTGVIDHPTIGLGPFAGTPPVGATGTVAAYYCQQYPILDECARSLDGGASWQATVPVKGCAGLFGHLKVGPDGTVYVPSRSCYPDTVFTGTSGVGGFVSRDNGGSWTSYVLPGTKWPDRGFDPSVGVGTDGSVFEAWSRDKDAHPVVAISRDGARRWTAPVDLAGTVKPPLVGSSFPAVVAGGPGRAAVAFLGTRHEVREGVWPYDDNDAVWHLYVATTYDGGTSWKTTQVTSDPVQRGPISDGGAAATDTRNLLDFMDAGLTREGRVVVGFADGCIARTRCTDDGATPATSTEQYATVAYQATGRGLLAQFDR